MQNRLLWLAIGVLIVIAGSVAAFLKFPYTGMTLILIGTVLGFGAVVLWRQKARK